MDLVKRLEQAARDCDAVVARSLHTPRYDQTAADYRELLLSAAKALRPPTYYIPSTIVCVGKRCP